MNALKWHRKPIVNMTATKLIWLQKRSHRLYFLCPAITPVGSQHVQTLKRGRNSFFTVISCLSVHIKRCSYKKPCFIKKKMSRCMHLVSFVINLYASRHNSFSRKLKSLGTPRPPPPPPPPPQHGLIIQHPPPPPPPTQGSTCFTPLQTIVSTMGFQINPFVPAILVLLHFSSSMGPIDGGGRERPIKEREHSAKELFTRLRILQRRMSKV